jgi:hypothetical protein
MFCYRTKSKLFESGNLLLLFVIYFSFIIIIIIIFRHFWQLKTSKITSFLKF